MGIVLGYVKRAHSDGSSPVTTTPFIVSFLVINRFYFHAGIIVRDIGILVRENRYAIFIDH